ncbi:ABC transporter ATP-binding protein [Pelagibacterium luteolum]|uniref:Multiple sugar transport system ATP-binding protein n=1 Tax=Pelagibacterium luteolum TaxID=440168 RepID=A0A1G7Z7S8_9HYPH|nr:sn-glycerol-3-phosphate ABC transporter ATP-binding protein UgpC [Pelagibacterium luteolum]SDH04803.1 multiple sugar transport system ATP-binding protein [Pelagibacterium luteolum]
MASVEFKSITKRYDALDVLNDVDISISDGEFVVFVGPSGCGKSTLLRMLAGLEPITAGSISISSEVVNALPPRDRDIAMVFQNYALYPHMSVGHNIGFPLRMVGTPKPEIERRVSEAAEMLGLTPYLARLPRELSGGQRQRVAMGRAVVREPSVFLFDEPLSNLDASLRVRMRGEIKRLHQRLGTTMIYVTHDQIEAMTLADRIVVLRGGKVEQIGTPLELYNSPASPFVAQFIGSPAMNIFEGTMDDECFVRITETRIALGTRPSGISSGAPLLVGIRPHDVALGDPGRGTLSGELQLVEEMGNARLLTIQVGGTSVQIETQHQIALLPGATVHLTMPPEKLHIFPK